LSHRYVSDRFLPDKAIDIIDEAGSRARLQKLTIPDELKKMQGDIEVLKIKRETAAADQEYEKAAQLKEKERLIQQKYRDGYSEWRNRVDSEIVTLDDDEVAEIVSNWTGIPLRKLEETDSEKLLTLETALHERIVSQE
jgi:ATP-dependent Clp protease ATP-binding subunit ClpC